MAAGVERDRLLIQERGRDAGLEVRIGAGPLAVGGAGSGRIEGRRRLARAARQEQGEAEDGDAKAGGPRHAGQGSRSTASTLGAVRGALRQLVRASRSVARVRPTIEPVEPGRGCHCDPSSSARTVPLTPTRDQPGDTWGVGHGTRNGRSVPRLTRVDGSRTWVTSRVTGHRPSGLGDRRDGSTYRTSRTFISALVALRYRRAIARSGLARLVRDGRAHRPPFPNRVRPSDRDAPRTRAPVAPRHACRGRPGSPARRARGPGRG